MFCSPEIRLEVFRSTFPGYEFHQGTGSRVVLWGTLYFEPLSKRDESANIQFYCVIISVTDGLENGRRITGEQIYLENVIGF